MGGGKNLQNCCFLFEIYYFCIKETFISTSKSVIISGILKDEFQETTWSPFLVTNLRMSVFIFLFEEYIRGLDLDHLFTFLT